MTMRRQRSWVRAAIALVAIYLLAIQSVLPRSTDAFGLSPFADVICASGQMTDGGDSERQPHPHQDFADCCVLSGRLHLDGPDVATGALPALVMPDATGGKAQSALHQDAAPSWRSLDPNRLRGPPANLV